VEIVTTVAVAVQAWGGISAASRSMSCRGVKCSSMCPSSRSLAKR
jgi:hypothetical protein